MWSRRDQLQAYQFLRRRLVSAVLLGDANHPESPSRRSVMSTVTGVVVTLLLLAGFGVWGAITQSASADWRAGGQVIVEKDNYAHYVLGSQDGALHPALNYTSALLFLGRQSPTVTLSRATISTAAQGRTIGIMGAPQALPAATALLTLPWTACARTATGVAGRVSTTVNLSVGMPEAGALLGVKDALLVQDAGSSRALHLVTQGRRFAVASPAVALSLGFRTPPIPVATAWLNALPAGPALRYLTEPTGSDGPVVAGVAVPVGQVITVSDPGRSPEYFVYRQEGLTAVSETEYRLITGNPGQGVRSRSLTRGELGSLPYSATAATGGDLGYPDPLPQAWSPPTGALALCATAPPDPERSRLMTVRVRLDLPATGTPTGAAPLAQNLADDVTVPATRGAVVHTSQGAGFVSETSYLVTDEGRRYLIPGATELGILGYGGRTLSAVPESMLAMLPQGPRLDQESARKEWPVAAGPPSASTPAPATGVSASPTASAAASVRTGRVRTTTGRTP